MAFDDALAERLRDVLAGKDAVEKRMFGGLCFMVGGNMACGILKSDLIVKVPKDQHAAMLARPGARPFDFTGKPMAGILFVAGDAVTDDAKLREWVDVGLRTAASAPPKRKR
jgi:hypothetical protein